MKVLLDECVPRPLKFDLIGHDVGHVTEMGWSGIKKRQIAGIGRWGWIRGIGHYRSEFAVPTKPAELQNRYRCFDCQIESD
jgi:hypothetical protein